MRGAPQLLCLAVGACILQASLAASSRRQLKDSAENSIPASVFPKFDIPGLLKPGAPAPAPEPLVQAQSGKFVFNTQLPESATNLGLGAVAFPGSSKNDLWTTVGKNITLFLEQQFEAGKCKFNKVYCQDVSDAFGQMLLDDLSSAGQFGASSSMSDSTISKLNDFFYVFQPKGLTSAPADLVAKVTKDTPTPTPDPTSTIITSIVTATNDFEAAVQKLTGFAPPPGGFSKVLEKFFGNAATIDGAAAAAAGAAGGR